MVGTLTLCPPYGLLAMTRESDTDLIVKQQIHLRILAAKAPELCVSVSPMKNRGRRESRVPVAPAASRAK
jgi:hypothetical protein